MSRKQAQTSIEFVFLVGLAFVIVVIFSIASRDKVSELSDEKEFILVKDLAFKVQNEINLAGRVEDGYRREFDIPQKLETIEYSISIDGNILVVETDSHDHILVVPKVNGSIQKGTNIITKKAGVINLNQE